MAKALILPSPVGRAVNDESGLAGFIKCAGQIHDLGDGQPFQSSGGRSSGSRAEIGSVMPGNDETRSAQCIQGSGESSCIARVLYLIQNKDEGPGQRR